jgi:5'-deoxynucleotidase YfbR-like HD superfamily hydrolase
MKNKLEERMVSHFIKCKLDWQCYKSSSTEQNQYIFKTMKSKKLWRCINKCINGNKQLKLLKRLIMAKFKSLKSTIILGYYNQVNKKKQQRLKNSKEIIQQQFNFT